MNTQKTGNAKRLLKIGLVAAIAVVVLIGGVVSWFLLQQKPPEPFVFDTAAMEGRIKQMTPEEIQAELNRVVEEGMFNISIASNIVFHNPGDEGEARIENIAANRYHMQVTITLADTGEEVFRSQGMRPGTAIKDIKLSKWLAPGTYNALATFNAITQDTYQLVGTAGAQIVLSVMDNGMLPSASFAPISQVRSRIDYGNTLMQWS